MEFILEFIFELVYVGLGRIVFGKKINSGENITIINKIILWVITLSLIVGFFYLVSCVIMLFNN